MASVQYIYLVVAWFLFGAVHSILASGAVKRVAMRRMKGYYKFYRISYSLIATVSLLIVLRYHFLCDGPLLWNMPWIQGALAFIAAIAGLVIMAICIRKYFLDLSGIDALLGVIRPPVLQLGGMHRYVRHPLYSGTLLFVWAIFFGYPYLNNLISCICMSLYTVTGMYFEEKKLVLEFGEPYQEYQKTVPALVPVPFGKL
ncbi:MAG: hypothetical protein JWQ78_510 [Sediminibacterium sp.]|nr:hypothetical protein [Sediminibacterium sp.]